MTLLFLCSYSNLETLTLLMILVKIPAFKFTRTGFYVQCIGWQILRLAIWVRVCKAPILIAVCL